MEWTNEKPNENGLYWLRREDRELTIVKIWDAPEDPTIAWIGSDWDSSLSEVEGLWWGPVEPPSV